MDQITRTQINALAAAQPKTAASIYLPTSRLTRDHEGDQLRLKNLITDARGQLLKLGLDMGDADALLAPAEDLAVDEDFWQHCSDGLALFLTADSAMRMRVPISFADTCICGPRFHIRPLLPMLRGNGAYFVCAASENEVRVFLGNREGLDEIDTPAPPNVAAANRFEEHERYLGFRSDAPARGGRIGSMYYGMGGQRDEHKEDVEEFARQLAKALDELLMGENAPLVLAGVESLVAMLRHRLNYRQVPEGAVIGSPDELSAAQLHEKAWPLALPFYDAVRQGALDEYAARAGTGRTATRLEEVLSAAADGQVDSIFISEPNQIWGSFDAGKRLVSVGDRETLGAVELLDQAAALVLLHGGDAYLLDPAAMPEGAPCAALLRF